MVEERNLMEEDCNLLIDRLSEELAIVKVTSNFIEW